MIASHQAMETAKNYLARCVPLREALEIPEGAILEPHPLGEGEHNLNFWFEYPDSDNRLIKYVLRINVLPQPFHIDQIGYEYSALSALSESHRTPLPLFLDNSEDAPGKGALVISYCEGEMLNFDSHNLKDMKCVAHILADIHATDPSKGKALFHPNDAMVDLFNECIERFDLYYASAYEDPRITKWARAFIDIAKHVLDDMPPANTCARIINTEPLPSHFLLPQGSGEFPYLGYFVDWERPLVGEVAQDLAFFTSPAVSFWDSGYIFERDLADTFLEMYRDAVGIRFDYGNAATRYIGYRIMTALRSVTWCCKALLRYGNLDSSQNSEQHTTDKTIEKLPIYLSDEFMEMLYLDCRSLVK